MRLSLEAAARGQETLWGAPTAQQSRLGWTELERTGLDADCFRVGVREVTVPPNNGVIAFVSLDDPGHARGRHPHRVVIDEAAYVDEEAWYQVLRPMLVYPDAEAWLLGTPCGKNWFWREALASIEREDTVAWHAPTLGCKIVDDELVRTPHELENSEFPWEELQHMFRALPRDIFRQEFMAEWIEGGGEVFRNVDGVSVLEVQAPRLGRAYTYGVDWAKHRDYTVFSVIDPIAKEQVYLERITRIDYEYQIERLCQIAKDYPPEVMEVEANAMGDALIEQLERRGLPVQRYWTSGQGKTKLIETLKLAMENDELKLLNDGVQKNELKAYQIEVLPSKSYRYNAPKGLHDDTVMALSLAWWGITNRVTADSFAFW